MKYQWMLIGIAGLAVFGSPVMAHQQGAHVHGLATLQVMQDGNTIAIHLDSPLDNLVGFEHAPRSDKQKQAVQTMTDKLRQPEALFALTPAAQCKPGPVQLHAPVLDLGATEKNRQAKPAEQGGHAGLQADMVFTCSNPAALKQMEVKLFEIFPGLRRLDVQIVGVRGQSAAQLTPRRRSLTW